MASLVGDYGNYCCFALAGGFERICAASSEERAAYDTDTSGSCEAKQSRRDRRFQLPADKTTRPRPSMKHGTLRPCAKCWCAASMFSMGTKSSMTCSKKTQTQRHGTLVVHTSIVEPHDGAGFGTLVNSARSLSLEPGRCPHRAGSKTREINEVDQAGLQDPRQ